MSCSSAPLTATSRSIPGKNAAAAETACATETVQQLAQLGGLDGGEQLPQVALQPLEGDLRLGGEIVLAVLVGGSLAQPGQLDLRPPAIAHLEETADEDGGAGGGDGVESLGVLPGNGLAAAAGVAEAEPQPGLAVALAAQLALADRVNPAHPLPVLQLAERHPGRNQRVGKSLLLHRNPK